MILKNLNFNKNKRKTETKEEKIAFPVNYKSLEASWKPEILKIQKNLEE